VFFAYVQVNYELYKSNAHFGGGGVGRGGNAVRRVQEAGSIAWLTLTSPLTGDGEGGITEGEGLEKERLEMEGVKGYV
jgi:hypothetical protein